MDDNMLFAIKESNYILKNFCSGTHRTISPDNTIKRIQPFSPVMGITRIANITGLDHIGIPVVMVCRPNSRSLSVSQGKGLTIEAAIASGIMESVESYHAENIQNQLKLSSYEELCYTHNVADVSMLPCLSDSRFHPNLRILWVKGTDLLTDETVWAPFDMVSLNFTLLRSEYSKCFPASSNGLSSGNHILEAISHGMCEVVERDSTSLWFARSKEYTAGTMVDISSIDDAACCEVIEKFDNAGIAFAVWDTTTDIGIPAFLCMIIDREDNHFRLMYPNLGMGCHPSRGIALLRALTEAAQSRLTLISGSRDDVTRSDYELIRNRDVLQRQRALIMENSECTKRGFREVPTFESDSFNEDITWMLKRLKGAGICSVIAVDITKHEFGIPVVKIIIPGLEGVHTTPGYVPGPRALAAMEECQ